MQKCPVGLSQWKKRKEKKEQMYNNEKVNELKKTCLRNSWLLDPKKIPLHLVSESILFCFFIFHIVVEGGGGHQCLTVLDIVRENILNIIKILRSELENN